MQQPYTRSHPRTRAERRACRVQADLRARHALRTRRSPAERASHYRGERRATRVALATIRRIAARAGR